MPSLPAESKSNFGRSGAETGLPVYLDKVSESEPRIERGAVGVSGGCDGAQNEMKTPLKSFLALLLGHRSPKEEEEKEEENFRGVGGEAMFATDRFSSASLRGFWTKPSFPT